MRRPLPTTFRGGGVMLDVTRRDVIKLALGVGLAAGGIDRAAGSQAEGSVSLEDAIRAFNEVAALDPIGKGEPALDRDEVAAAIRWATLDRARLPVSDRTFESHRNVADTGRLPKGFEFEKLNGYEPNDRLTFEVWSVRLMVPREPEGTFSLTIRERMIRSRPIGEEERKVIHEWKAKERPGGFERVEWMRKYRQERAKAAAIDRAKP
jgi:hypothetical protein